MSALGDLLDKRCPLSVCLFNTSVCLRFKVCWSFSRFTLLLCSMPTALLEPRPVNDSLLHVIHAFAGAVGSVSSLAVTYPLYSAVVRQQADHGRLDGKKTASLLDILWREGPTSLYQGFFQGLFATTSQSFVYYFAYDMLNSFHRVRTRPRRSSWNLVAGFEAGVVTVLLTHPLWVVNYREVTTTREASGLEGDCSIWSIFQSQGLSGLYSGVVPALMLCVSPAVQFFSLGLLFACRSYLLSRARSGSEKPLQNVELLLFGAISKALCHTCFLSTADGEGKSFEVSLKWSGGFPWSHGLCTAHSSEGRFLWFFPGVGK